MRKVFAILAGAAVFVSGLIGLSSSALAADTGTNLSPYGDSTMQDVASCLRTANQLDVFYLIDNSKSLGPDAKSGTTGTDPGYLRADIVAQDIKRWADILAIQPSLKIRVAGSFFAATATPLASWTELSKSNASAVASKFRSTIKSKQLDFYTNWTAGLKDAYSNLDDSPAECKALVWFTDGGLWSADPRSNSLKDLAVLCGSLNSANHISSLAGAEGLMASIRRANINIFGIMLSPEGTALSTGEKDEDYYKSLMQPLVEETGPGISGAGDLPSGTLVCGEKASAEDRTYATGAYLKAVSAAQIAYSFLLLNSKVAGGTAQVGEAGGKFWLDPGIKSFEILTSAKNWTVEDGSGKVIMASGSRDLLGTTGRIAVRKLKEPEQWRFKSDAPYTVVVYPELYLRLHDNAVFTGRESHVTGQFVSNLSTGEPANLSEFTKSAISVTVNGKPVKAAITPSGVFSLASYTPFRGQQALQIRATLTVQTEHHPDLAPLRFELTQPILQSQTLPSVGVIAFKRPLVGSKSSANAHFSIAGPASGQSGSVCFSKPAVMADNQDQSAGKATNRAFDWDLTFQGLDPRGCVTVPAGETTHVLTTAANGVQADSHVQLLYSYSLSAGDGSQVKDSQSVNLDTRRNTQGGLFWLWFIGLSLLSLLIPYAVLHAISAPAARIYASRGLDRASVPFTYYVDSKYIANAAGSTTFDPVEASKAFVQPSRSVPEAGVSSYTDAETGVTITGKRSRWPLNPPIFTFAAPPGVIAVPVGQSADSTRISRESSRLSNGKLADLAFVVLDADAAIKVASTRQASGNLIVFNADQTGQYAGVLSSHFTKPAVAQNIDLLLASKPSVAKNLTSSKQIRHKKSKSRTEPKVTSFAATTYEPNDGIESSSQTNNPSQPSSTISYDPYSDI
jgi:hypothetical protein